MDSKPDFDDEQFFDSYDAEQATAALSLPPLESEAQDLPSSEEQLARITRFRKPVALVLGALAMLLVVAVQERGAQHQKQRELVAHYSAATPAPEATPTPLELPDVVLSAEPEEEVESSPGSSPAPAASNEFFAALGTRTPAAFVAAVGSEASPMCLRSGGESSVARPSHGSSARSARSVKRAPAPTPARAAPTPTTQPARFNPVARFPDVRN